MEIYCKECDKDFTVNSGNVSIVCQNCMGTLLKFDSDAAMKCLMCGNGINALENKELNTKCTCGSTLYCVTIVVTNKPKPELVINTVNVESVENTENVIEAVVEYPEQTVEPEIKQQIEPEQKKDYAKEINSLKTIKEMAKYVVDNNVKIGWKCRTNKGRFRAELKKWANNQ